MLSRKKLALKMGMVLGAFIIAGIALYFWLGYSLQFAFAKADFKPLGIVFKKAASDVLVVRQPSNSEKKSGALLDLYQQNPIAFQSDAKLFDAWIAALRVGKATLSHTASGSWVRSTANASYLSPSQQTDPWHHPFCLLRRGDWLLVVSGGPKAPASPTCENIQIADHELAQFPLGKLFETPSGNLALVLDTKHSESPVPIS
ncbi:MAG TPA: hypothetical protein VFA85_07560 [Terriglobales bacterium]|nr:hypothetical protein [Terriglobales bacterium]